MVLGLYVKVVVNYLLPLQSFREKKNQSSSKLITFPVAIYFSQLLGNDDVIHEVNVV